MKINQILNEVKPGQKVEFEPTDYIDPEFQKHLPSDETKKKQAELKEKMEAIQKELDELYEKIYKAREAQRNAEKEHEALEGIPQELVNCMSMIKRDCSEALNEMKRADNFLYRGLRMSQYQEGMPNIFVGKPRENRKAKDSATDVQEKFDNLLKEAGFQALRSNSIFCSGNKSQASGYGEMYCIFPKNGYACTWSPKFSDLYSDLLSGLKYGKGFASLFQSEEYNDLKSSLIFALNKCTKCLNELYSYLSNIINHGIKPENSEELNYHHFLATAYDNSMASPEELADWFKGNEAWAKRAFKNINLYTTAVKNAIKLSKAFLSKIQSREDAYSDDNVMADLNRLLQVYKRIDATHVIFVFRKALDYYLPFGGNPELMNSNVVAAIKNYTSFDKHPALTAQQVITEKLQFKNNDLADAIGSGNEICLAGEYYAINYSMYIEYLDKIMGFNQD
jgi:hypothetical protein